MKVGTWSFVSQMDKLQAVLYDLSFKLHERDIRVTSFSSDIAISTAQLIPIAYDMLNSLELWIIPLVVIFLL
jgi:hypothetical protein